MAGTKQFYFFIGRTTPPHFGHIHVLRETIELARASHTCALFLLGNGPGGMRTRENPIRHETKSEFIAHKLKELGCIEGTDFVIEMMHHPPNHQIESFVEKQLTSDSHDITRVSVFQVAGGKDDDTSKHEFVRTSTCKNLHKKYNEHPTFNCGVVTIDPVSGGVTASGETISAMSATKVRNKAVECYEHARSNADDAFQQWIREFPFYNGDHQTLQLSRSIFDQIIEHKDTEYSASKTAHSKTARAHPYSSTSDTTATHVKSRSAKSEPSTRKKKEGGRGRSRKHIRRTSISSRNKKTLRNIRK